MTRTTLDAPTVTTLATPADDLGPALERRGRAWLLWSFLLCPCHLPLSLAALTTVMAGTSFGVLLRDHPWSAATVISSAWIVGTAYGFRLIRRAQRANGACPIRASAKAASQVSAEPRVRNAMQNDQPPPAGARTTGEAMDYGNSITIDAPFADTVERVRDELKTEGFGVLTEIDMTATMHGKLGVEMEDYVILGACNPPLAHAALQTDRSIGLLLPCNVVVRATEGGTTVEALDPRIMVEVSDHPELKTVADDAADRLRRVLDRLADA